MEVQNTRKPDIILVPVIVESCEVHSTKINSRVLQPIGYGF